MVRLLASDI